MRKTTQRPARLRATLAGLGLLLLLMLPGLARAVCTGWPAGTTQGKISVTLPQTLTIPADATAGTVLTRGYEAFNPGALSCTSGGQPVTSTTWSWNQNGGSGTSTIGLAAGLGLRLTPQNPGSCLSDLPWQGGSANTGGFNWAAVAWELVRTSATLSTGSVSGATIGTGMIQADGQAWPVSVITSTMTVSASCNLSVDKSLVTLPDTDAGVLARDGVSAAASLTAYVTCPANTTLSGGISLTLATAKADATDNTLVGNTGTATGVAIEVLGSDGKRVSVQGGTVTQKAFTQSSTSSAGASQAFSVRMAHLNGQTVSAGTVQGTFTLTVSVN